MAFELLARLEVSAASGWISHGRHLYVVADDGWQLLRTSTEGADVTRVQLGAMTDVPLSLTDVCIGPRGEIMFTAAAEATRNPYEDGEDAGSISAILDETFRVVSRSAPGLSSRT